MHKTNKQTTTAGSDHPHIFRRTSPEHFQSKWQYEFIRVPQAVLSIEKSTKKIYLE